MVDKIALRAIDSASVSHEPTTTESIYTVIDSAERPTEFSIVINHPDDFRLTDKLLDELQRTAGHLTPVGAWILYTFDATLLKICSN